MALGCPSLQAERERVVALATKIAAERDPVKFHILALELERLLNKRNLPSRRDKRGKIVTLVPRKPAK